MIIHRLIYEIVDSEHPHDEHYNSVNRYPFRDCNVIPNRPTITAQKAISEGDMANMQPQVIPLLLTEIQRDLMSTMSNAMEQLNYQITKTPEEILNDNLRNIINL